MVESGEADHLVPERVWQELAKGLMEDEPERMFDVLEATRLQQKLLPELRERIGISGALPVRFARLAWPLKEPEVEALCRAAEGARRSARARAPRLPQPGSAARLAARNAAGAAGDPQARRCLPAPGALRELLEVARRDVPMVDTARVEQALEAANSVDAGASPAGDNPKRSRSSSTPRGSRPSSAAMKFYLVALYRNLVAGARLALFMRVRAFDYRVSPLDYTSLLAFNFAMWVSAAAIRAGLEGEFDPAALPIYLASIPLALATAMLVVAAFGARERLLLVATALTASDPVFEIAGLALPWLAGVSGSPRGRCSRCWRGCGSSRCAP